MQLVKYEVKTGVFKGILFGIREYDFEGESVREKDIVVYLGIFQVILTLVYNK